MTKQYKVDAVQSLYYNNIFLYAAAPLLIWSILFMHINDYMLVYKYACHCFLNA